MNDRNEYRDLDRDPPLVPLERHAAATDPDPADPRVTDRMTDRGISDPATARADASTHVDAEAPLFSREETSQLRDRWESVQAGFVDEPRRAVEEADGLVRQVMDRLTDGFAHQRERLEREWDARDETSTEDLRVALRHYRSFFDRLLRM